MHVLTKLLHCLPFSFTALQMVVRTSPTKIRTTMLLIMTKKSKSRDSFQVFLSLFTVVVSNSAHLLHGILDDTLRMRDRTLLYYLCTCL